MNEQTQLKHIIQLFKESKTHIKNNQASIYGHNFIIFLESIHLPRHFTVGAT